MQIERQQQTSYLMAVAPSVIIYNIFAVELCLILSLTFIMGQVQMQICQLKAYVGLCI